MLFAGLVAWWSVLFLLGVMLHISQRLKITTYHSLLFFRVEIISSGAKVPKCFHRKFDSTKNLKTWKMANNFTLLGSLHLLLSTSFCSHVSLERNIKFGHEFRTWNIMPSVNFLSRNIFFRKRSDNNFSHKFFGIEITQTKIKQITVAFINAKVYIFTQWYETFNM